MPPRRSPATPGTRQEGVPRSRFLWVPTARWHLDESLRIAARTFLQGNTCPRRVLEDLHSAPRTSWPLKRSAPPAVLLALPCPLFARRAASLLPRLLLETIDLRSRRSPRKWNLAQ